ncbi:MAG: hypothetical protein K2J76_02320 [Oscillospiraceae bacterium]|nr:hypothetical protein [Oscillospiraceae bacterium]
MNISSAKSPYLLQVERSNRPKATFGNRFRIAVNGEEAESQVTETAEEEEEVTQYYDEEAEAAGKIVKSKEEEEAEEEEEENEFPYYNIKDEEAEYFLEKYGEKYNEDTAQELYYELADKGIISRNDACNASGVLEIMPIGSAKSVVYFGTHLNGRENMSPLGSFSTLTDNAVYAKDVTRTDKNSPYKKLWESFKKAYDRDIDTWEDVLQENIDFERYLKEVKGSDYLFQLHSDKVIEGLEKTKDVITRIFGEVTL